MIELVVADIGGTHARFAIAEVEGGRVCRLGEPCTFITGEHASLQDAWAAFRNMAGRTLPRALSIAVAGPVVGEVLKLTNNPWLIRPSHIAAKLGVDTCMLLNDFGAVAHAVAHLGQEHFEVKFGPHKPLEAATVVSVLGPGTGLGAALFVRAPKGCRVIETETGHVDFAPLDPLEDSILAFLRGRYRRVSVERIVSGPGLGNLYEALASIEGRPVQIGDDKTLWAKAITRADSLAERALDRFCLSFGSLAGDIALTHGASAVVLAGDLTARLDEYIHGASFRQRFVAKGRFEQRMGEIPVLRLTHPQPGLFGAAAAFAMEHAG